MVLGNVCDFVCQYRCQFIFVVGSCYDIGMYINVIVIKGKCVYGVVINNKELEGEFCIVGLQYQMIVEVLNIFINYWVVNDWCLFVYLVYDGIVN